MFSLNDRHALTLASVLVFAAVAACTTARPVQSPPSATNGSDAEFAQSVVALRKSLMSTRAQLDSLLGQLHRESRDGSASSVARSMQQIKRISIVDSAYRSTLVDFRWALSSSNLSSATPTTHFSGSPPPSPLLQPFADGEDWMLESPMIFKAGKKNPLILIVPRGFVTDYASVPRPLRLLLPREGTYGNAAVLHDYLYWRQDCTREQSDNIMVIAMLEAGVSESTLRAIQLGIRLGGQGSWDTNRTERASGLLRTVGAPFDQVPAGANWDDYREWLRGHNARTGMEYAVPPRMCAMGDSDKLPD
ncbi:MAG TPA: DUF1353 domain-containing protein [Gemmatimonadaceae bacterium]|nr:DUF1353 domain-containing protein [Gemmatimonadaceae bacterium]